MWYIYKTYRIQIYWRNGWKILAYVCPKKKGWPPPSEEVWDVAPGSNYILLGSLYERLRCHNPYAIHYPRPDKVPYGRPYLPTKGGTGGYLASQRAQLTSGAVWVTIDYCYHGIDVRELLNKYGRLSVCTTIHRQWDRDGGSRMMRRPLPLLLNWTPITTLQMWWVRGWVLHFPHPRLQ